jgi:hypothetical protein
MASEDFHRIRPNTPQGSIETSSFDFEAQFNGGSQRNRPQQQEKLHNYHIDFEHGSENNNNDMKQEIKEIRLSNNSSSNEHENIPYFQPNGHRHIPSVIVPKRTPRQAERPNKSSSQTRRPKESGVNGTKVWQHRQNKEIGVIKQFTNKHSLSTVDNSTTTTRKSRRDQPTTAKIDSHPSYDKDKNGPDVLSNFKVEDRLREFKMLKESFLRSVFTKSKDDHAKPGSRLPPTRHFTNKSFDEKNHRNVSDALKVAKFS